jgi:hypothetical protein
MNSKLLLFSFLIVLNFLIEPLLFCQDQIPDATANVELPANCFDSDCVLCYLTRYFEEGITKELVEYFDLTDGAYPGKMENYDKGVSVIASKGIGTIEFITKRYTGFLPGIGSSNISKSELEEKYPDNLWDFDHLKFYFESMIEVRVFFTKDFSAIKEVEYSPLDFIQFYDNCFIDGINSQVAFNEDAFKKLSVVRNLEYIFVRSGYNFENLDPAQLGYFANGKAKENVFAVKLFAGLDEQVIDFVFNEMKSMIEVIDQGSIILISRSAENNEIISDEIKNLICEITGTSIIETAKFSFTSYVTFASIYTKYENNSINLIINPSAGGGFDLILVVING